MAQDNINNAMSPAFYAPDSQVYLNGSMNGNGVHFPTGHSSPALSGHSSPLPQQLQPYPPQPQPFNFNPLAPQSLTVQPPPPPQIFPSQHDAICYHLYHIGFLTGQFSDVLLHVPAFDGQTYKLHSLILARSPFLRHIILSSPSRSEITLSIEDPNITEEAFALAVGHLYAAYSQALIGPKNARHVLAAAFFFQLEDLCSLATEIIKKDISRHNALMYAQFIEGEHQVISYGAFGREIKDALFEFFTKGLVKELEQAYSAPSANGDRDNAAANPPTPHATLVHIYTQLPFDYLKRCIDIVRLTSVASSPDMARYQFAKEVVALREKQKKARGQGSDVLGGEESVVLAFGGAKGRVQLVRKPLKQQGVKTKTLWKVPQ